MIGQHAITADQLADAAGRVREVADLDRLATSLAGSFHLVASVAGRVRVQGTVTGVRRVFHARVGGATVAADRADVLAGLLDAGLDEQRLALHLLEPHILYPLAGQPVWQGVELLPTDHYLVLDGDGRHRPVRWWTPPEPVVPMAEGAPVLREALSDAVAARTRGPSWSAATWAGWTRPRSAASPPAGRPRSSPTPPPARIPWPTTSPGPLRTVAGLGNVEHHVIPAEEMPLVYHGLAGHGRPAGRAVQRRRGARTVAHHRQASRGPRLAAAPDRLRRGRAAVRLARPPALAAADQPQDRPPAPARLRRQVPVAPRPDAAAAVGPQPLPRVAGPRRRHPHRPAAADE